MTDEALKSYLLNKPQAEEYYPFGPDVAVFKVCGKMFALIGHREWKGRSTRMLNLKIAPDESFALRDIFPSITPGYHMSKTHWISIYFDGSVPDGEVKRLIDNSYHLIVASLPKAKRLRLTE